MIQIYFINNYGRKHRKEYDFKEYAWSMDILGDVNDHFDDNEYLKNIVKQLLLCIKDNIFNISKLYNYTIKKKQRGYIWTTMMSIIS